MTYYEITELGIINIILPSIALGIINIILPSIALGIMISSWIWYKWTKKHGWIIKKNIYFNNGKLFIEPKFL